MSDPNLPTASDANEDAQQPEVRLELTRAGVQEVLSLYSQEQRGAPDEPTFTLRFADIEEAFRRRQGMLGIGTVIGLVLAIFVILASTSLYPVTAQVVIERHDMTRAEATTRAGNAGSAFVATQAEVMQSESVLADAVASIPRAAHLDDDDDAVADAVEAVRASPVSGTQVVALGYLGPDANHGVALLEAIVSAYKRALGAAEATVQREKLRAKQAEIDVIEGEAVALEAKLNVMRREKGTLGSAEDTSDAQTRVLQDLAAQLTDIRNQRIALENRLATGSEQLAILDPATRSIQEQLWSAQAELSRVRITLTAEHPAVEAAESEVAVLRRQLVANSKATPEALKRDITASLGLEKELERVYDRERATMGGIERDRREESLLLAELDRIRELSNIRRSELLDQRLLTRLAETGEIGVSARLIERPSLPAGAAWPRPRLLLPMGAIIGFLAGFVAAVISLQRERDLSRPAEEAWVPPSRAGAGVEVR